MPKNPPARVSLKAVGVGSAGKKMGAAGFARQTFAVHCLTALPDNPPRVGRFLVIPGNGPHSADNGAARGKPFAACGKSFAACGKPRVRGRQSSGGGEKPFARDGKSRARGEKRSKARFFP
jgi:hypothetical protein